MTSHAEIHEKTNIQTYKVGLRSDDRATKLIFDELSQHFQFKTEYVYYEQFSNLLHDIANGNLDFSANVTYSKERADYIDVSRPTNIEYTYFYSLPEFSDQHNLTHIHSVGVAKEIIFRDYVESTFPGIKVVEFSTYQEAEQLIRSGQVDGVIDSISKLDLFLGDGFDAQILNDTLPIMPVGIASAKGKYNQFVDQMVDYLHTAQMQKRLRLRFEDYQKAARIDALRVRMKTLGIAPSIPLKIKLENVIQLTEYDKAGNIHGIGGEILHQVCQVLAMNCVIQSKADDPWEGMLSDFMHNRIDVLGPVTITPARKKIMNFSAPYFYPQAVLVKRTGYKENVYRSVSELIAERISVIKGDYYDQLLTNMLPGKEIYRMDSRDEQMKALAAGKIDYVVLNRENYNKMLIDGVADFSTEEEQSIGMFNRSSIGFAFPKTEKGKNLAILFSAAQKLIDVNAIVAKYDVKPDWRSVIRHEKSFNQMVWSVLIGGILIMCLVVWIVYRQSITDNLTKLRNRRALYQRFSRGIPKEHTLVYIDVNQFKAINDTYGHRSGDLVLQQLASLISTHWKGHSFRIGGDEFVLVDLINQDKLTEILTKLETFSVEINEHKTIDVQTSCGISAHRKETMDIDSVLHLADKKMYVAKLSSRQDTKDASQDFKDMVRQVRSMMKS